MNDIGPPQTNPFLFHLMIDYDTINESFCFLTDVELDHLKTFLNDFLAQVGHNDLLPNKRDLYLIDITFDSEHNVWSSKHSCGSSDLQCELLRELIKRLGP